MTPVALRIPEQRIVGTCVFPGEACFQDLIWPQQVVLLGFCRGTCRRGQGLIRARSLSFFFVVELDRDILVQKSGVNRASLIFFVCPCVLFVSVSLAASSCLSGLLRVGDQAPADA